MFLIHQPLLEKPCSNYIRNMSKMLAEKCRDKLRFPHFCPMLEKILDQIWSVTNQLWSLSSYTKFFSPLFFLLLFLLFLDCVLINCLFYCTDFSSNECCDFWLYKIKSLATFWTMNYLTAFLLNQFHDDVGIVGVPKYSLVAGKVLHWTSFCTLFHNIQSALK